MEDGTEREVPTADELAALTAKATELDTVKAEYEKTKAELAQAENPNWKALRTQAEQMRAKLAEKGVQFDGSGNPLPEGQVAQVKPEEIFNTARDAAKGVLIEDTFNKSIAKLDKDSQSLVKRHYDKLTSGETIDSGNIDFFIKAAMGAAGVTTAPVRSSGNMYGGEPGVPSEAQATKQRGLEIAKELGYKIKTDISKS